MPPARRAADPERALDLGARASHDRLEERNRPSSVGRARLHADRRRLAGGRRADRGALAGREGPARSGAPVVNQRRPKILPEEPGCYEPTNDPRSGPLGTGVSYYVLLHGIVQHDVYHSGQIALLKKAR